MEQSISLPVDRHIPKSIDQQLAVYQLGTLLEIYKQGWRKDRSTKPTTLLFMVAALAVGIISGISTFGIAQANHRFPASLLVISGVAFIVAFAAIPALFQARLCVCAFSEGLMYAKNTRVTVLRWYEIERIEQKEKYSRFLRTIFRLYTIYTHDGRIFNVKGSYLRVDGLGKILSEKIWRCR